MSEQMESQHTPLPWHRVEPVSLGYEAPRIYDLDNKSLIATLEGGGRVRAISAAEARENAALIVKAVNLYDEFVTALRDIAGGMNSASPPNWMLELGPGKFHEAFVPLLQRVARDALAKVDAP